MDKEETNTNVDLHFTSMIVEYLALAISLKTDSPAKDYRKANELSWHLATFLSADLYRRILKAIIKPNEFLNPLTIVMELKNMNDGSEKNPLKEGEIAHHAPNIGIKNGKLTCDF